MIEISSLCSGYGKQEILHDVDLNCPSGKITTIIGPNGCGKSTLLKAAIGILGINSGDIKIDGRSVKTMSDNARARKIAYLSQGKNIPDISVERMVLHGRFSYLSYPRKYRKCDFEAAAAAMEQMGIEALRDRPLASLSGGMRQKVYIAMALCQGADIIMLDEPATYLDVAQQIKMTELCKQLSQSGKTVITVSHDIVSALKHSDLIAVMQDGKIITVGAPNEIIEQGVILRVFGVDIKGFEHDGQKEFYF